MELLAVGQTVLLALPPVDPPVGFDAPSWDRGPPMRQIEAARFGGPDVLQMTTAADPTPSPGQVLVGVSVAGVSGLDVAIRRGAGGPFAVTPPYLPGLGAAGIVRGVGRDVDPTWIGTRVVTDVDGGGAYAQLLVAPTTGLVPVPDSVEDQTAAALLHDGRTALTLLEATHVTPGETVLVMPAAGGLGSILVELLARRGAHVIGAARGHDKLTAARALGAEHTIDYTTDGWSDALSDVDVVFDGVGGAVGRRAGGLLGAGGRFSSYGLASGEVATLDPTQAHSRRIAVQDMSQLMVAPETHRQRIQQILAAAADDHIHPTIGRIDPLHDAALSHAAFEARGITGKALLLVE